MKLLFPGKWVDGGSSSSYPINLFNVTFYPFGSFLLRFSLRPSLSLSLYLSLTHPNTRKTKNHNFLYKKNHFLLSTSTWPWKRNKFFGCLGPRRHQCYQNGLFLKDLGYKFSTKITQNFGYFGGYFETRAFCSKN